MILLKVTCNTLTHTAKAVPLTSNQFHNHRDDVQGSEKKNFHFVSGLRQKDGNRDEVTENTAASQGAVEEKMLVSCTQTDHV